MRLLLEPFRPGGIAASWLVLVLVGAGAAGAQAAPVGARVQAIVGTVRDTAGFPLEGAIVRTGDRQVRTSALGSFRIDSLPAGRHTLDVRLIGYRTVRSVVPVVATEPTEIDFFLVPTAALLPTVEIASRRTGIHGLVGDTAFRAVPGARVQLLGPGGGELLTDSLGRFAFPEAERGQYMLRVTFRGYTERRIMVELERDEGREYAVLLSPSVERPSMRAEAAMRDLDQRLVWSRRRLLLTASDLSRAGTMPLCDLAAIKSEVGTRNTTLILNGETVLRDWPVSALCSWRADDVDLVEFGRDVCVDESRTIADRLGIWCTGRARSVPRSINPSASGGGAGVRSYVVVWEKR